MLRISKTQFEAFQTEAVSTFEAETLERCAKLSPLHSAVLGKDGLLRAIRAAVQRAASHGFTFAGPVRLFIDLSLLFGSGFDVDVQYPWAQESLGSRDPSTQIGRSRTLYGRSLEALGQVNGPDNRYTYAALRRLQTLVSAPPPLRAEDFSTIVLTEMERIHPQKFAYVGEPALRSLIAAGEAEAASHGLSELPDVLLVILLMFAFGQGCTNDPLYPWIARTLGDDRISTPALRAGKLEEKALLWIRAVLANEKEVRS